MLKKVGKNFDILKIKRNFDIFLFEAFFILIAFAFWVFWYYKKSIVFNNLSMSAIEGVYFVLMGEHFFYGGGIFIIPGIILVVIGVYRVITINNKKNKQLKKSEEEYKRVFGC